MRDLFKKEIDDWEGIISAEVLDSRSTERNTSTDDLLKEKRALGERIAEIDKMLAGRE